MTRRTLTVILLALACMPACSKQEPTLLRIGDHTISVHLPEGWEHFNYGERHQLRRDFARISLDDLGLQGRDLDRVATKVMPSLGENDRRSVASKQHFLIGDRDALALDTWDTFSHQYRKRYVFVIDEGSLLAIYTMQGEFSEMEKAFDGLIASVAFVDSLGGDASGDSLRQEQTQ